MRSTGQSHLFRDVVYSFRCEPTGTKGGFKLYTHLLRRLNNPRRTLRTLYTFLQDQPSLGGAVRRLRLVAYPAHGEENIEVYVDEGLTFTFSDNIETSLFHQLLALLPLLEELELANIELLSSRAYWTSRTAPLPSLQRLVIVYPERDDQSDNRIVEILGCFDSIDEVLIGNVELDYHDHDAAPYKSIPPSSVRIRSFVLFDHTWIFGGLFSFLRRSPSSRTLRNLDVTSFIPKTDALVELQQLI